MDGTVAADARDHTGGHKGPATHGGNKPLGRWARRRRTTREPGRGHEAQDRPAVIAGVRRQGPVVGQAVREFTVTTVQPAADLAVEAGSRR